MKDGSILIIFIGICLLLFIADWLSVWNRKRKENSTELINRFNENKYNQKQEEYDDSAKATEDRFMEEFMVKTPRLILPILAKIEYEDANENITERTITIESISSDGYIEAYCHLRGGVRTFIADNIIGNVTIIDTGESDRFNKLFKHYLYPSLFKDQ